jgi:hypothetical protein
MQGHEGQNPRPLRPWLGLVPLAAAALVMVGAGALGRSWIVLAPAVFHVVLLELIASWTARRGRSEPALQPISDAGVHLTRVVEVALALGMAFLSLVVGLSWPVRPGWIVLVLLGAVSVAVALGLRRMARALAAVRAAGLGDRVKGYGPLLYINPDDPRLWVPKLFGPGVTLNFARPVAWVILIAILIPPLAGATVALIFASRAAGR